MLHGVPATVGGNVTYTSAKVLSLIERRAGIE